VCSLNNTVDSECHLDIGFSNLKISLYTTYILEITILLDLHPLEGSTRNFIFCEPYPTQHIDITVKFDAKSV
jgi:hypothetical protein